MKRILALALLVGLGLSTTLYRAEAAKPDAAEAFVQDLIDKAIDAMTIPTSEEAKRRAAFEKLLQEKLDFATIRERVLGGEWNRATPEQKERFASVFDDYILNVYVGQLGPYDQQEVKVSRAETLDEDETVVFTQVIPTDGSSLRLDWRIREDSDGHYGVGGRRRRRGEPAESQARRIQKHRQTPRDGRVDRSDRRPERESQKLSERGTCRSVPLSR